MPINLGGDPEAQAAAEASLAMQQFVAGAGRAIGSRSPSVVQSKV